jgi:hypothetical protein
LQPDVQGGGVFFESEQLFFFQHFASVLLPANFRKLPAWPAPDHVKRVTERSLMHSAVLEVAIPKASSQLCIQQCSFDSWDKRTRFSFGKT